MQPLTIEGTCVSGSSATNCGAVKIHKHTHAHTHVHTQHIHAHTHTNTQRLQTHTHTNMQTQTTHTHTHVHAGTFITKHVPCIIVGQRGPSMLRSTRLTRGRHSSAEIWRAAWRSTLLSTLLYVSACLQPSFDLIVVIMSETDRVVFHAR